MCKKLLIPVDVPKDKERMYADNYCAITGCADRLLLFAADHKIEHLNADFFGKDIHPEANKPEHLFRIAEAINAGAFATQLGLIARYGDRYSLINYIAKITSKTNLISASQDDAISSQMWSVADVMKVKEKSALAIRGIGCTLYLGSGYEAEMLKQTAQIIFQAHQQGLIAIVWIYARGKSIADDTSSFLIEGAAGIANALGADFVKVKPPHHTMQSTSDQHLTVAIEAAGNTRVICSGGERIAIENLLKNVYDQIAIGRASGCAVGRNLFQRSLKEAVAIGQALKAIVYENKDNSSAYKIYRALVNS